MTDKGKQQLKNIIIQALSEYFEQSGINKILLSLYQNKSIVSPPKKPANKIANILEKNSKISQLKKSEIVNYNDDDNLLDLPSMGVEGTKISPNLRVKLNENIDPLETGQSILDDIESLPNFLTKGLAKIKKNASN